MRDKGRTHPALTCRSPCLTQLVGVSDVQELKRHGVGEDESELGADFISPVLPIRCTPIGHTSIKCTPMRCKPMTRCILCEMHRDRHEEGINDGELPESQHGAIGRRS